MTEHYKHFSKYDRDLIEKMLDRDSTALMIAEHTGKTDRAISYEVREHRTKHPSSFTNCSKANECKSKNICYDCPRSLRYRLCKNCRHRRCSEYCDEYTSDPLCKRLLRFPYVCNACEDKGKCKITKYFYKSQRADELYKQNVTNWKKGVRIPMSELMRVNEVLSEGIKRGNSIEVVLARNDLPVSVSTAYKYLHDGYLDVHEIDLPYQVRYKSRKKRTNTDYNVNYNCLEGRRFEDYHDYLTTHPSINIWQMDTIEGIKGKDEPCILSLLYCPTNLQLYFKLATKTIAEVNRVFSYIKASLGTQLFSETFSIILTDNGSEFKDPLSIEMDEFSKNEEKLVHVFYCHPGRSDEKAKCERNHKELRRMVPQGISWKPYDEKDILWISENVNNYYRPDLRTTPYLKSLRLLDEKVLALNRLKQIASDQVILKEFIKK